MNEITMELVGIAASISGHCRPCFLYHYKKAKELGVPAEDIDGAIDLAIRISASGDSKMLEFANREMRKEAKDDDR